ncbi:MAG: glutaredoxin 3 [Bradymonadia bacterium]|jgi:glutaredoxin 3
MTVQVYTTRICAYCGAAKRLLKKKGVEFEEVDVSHDAEKRQWMVQTSGQRTVPQIYINDKSIGGYSELSALEKSGQLDALLAG